MLERIWRKVNAPTPLVGMSTDKAIMENSTEVPQKMKNRTTILSCNPTSGYIRKGNANGYKVSFCTYSEYIKPTKFYTLNG